MSPAGKITPPIVALHFVPISNFAKSESYDPVIFSNHSVLLTPRERYTSKKLYNFDGFLMVSNGEQGADFYAQGFRDLRLEMIWGEYCGNNERARLIPQTQLAIELITSVNDGLRFYEKSDVELPIVIMFSLVGVKDCVFHSTHFAGTQNPFDRDVLQFPSILVSEYGSDTARLLQPTLDILWQTAGFHHCLEYDADGEWRQRNLL